ncbi:polysaccharide biosynthesis protein [Stenotrophomonas maltophilia]|nr:polysaccharide biosynthesis protein [Stenotrophomonas maltophilia]PZT14192.1 polysaccharide biosynthesis protein [Stenotrophomonas maltophilia]
MPARLPRLGNLARTSILVMFWQGMRMACLAAWIILGARVLGATDYGLFSGTVGTASALAGLVGLGSGMLMYQYSTADHGKFPRYWKQSLVLCALSAAPLSLAFSLLTAGLMSWPALGLVALSEIIAFPIVTNAAFAFSANDRLGWAAALPALNAGMRLAAICIFGLLPVDHNLTTYLLLHLASSACSAVLALMLVRRILRPGPAHLQIGRSDLKHGTGHAAAWSSAVAVTTLDKSLVLHAGGSELAGLYAACYRIAAVIAMPLDAMVMSAMPRLFRAQPVSPQHLHLIVSMILVATAYGTLGGLVLWCTAGILPSVLGIEFSAAIPGLQWMGLFIIGYSLRQIACNVLIGRGKKMHRFIIETLGLMIMTLIAATWIPAHGLLGAVWMIIVAEALMAMAAWLTVIFSPGSEVAQLPS